MSKVEISFQQVKKDAKNPGSVTPAEWKTGMAVTETLFAEGEPENTVENSIVAPGADKHFPNKYDLGDSTTVEHMPHWSYAIFQKGKQRELFSLNASRLPTEKVVQNVKDKIQQMKKGKK